MFLGVGESFLLFACVGVKCCVGVAVWFRTCELAPVPACGLAAQTDVGPGFDSTSFGKAGRVDTICIPKRDVGPTAEKTVSFGPLKLLPFTD